MARKTRHARRASTRRHRHRRSARKSLFSARRSRRTRRGGGLNDGIKSVDIDDMEHSTFTGFPEPGMIEVDLAGDNPDNNWITTNKKNNNLSNRLSNAFKRRTTSKV